MINNLDQTSFTQQWVFVMIIIKNSNSCSKLLAHIILVITLAQPIFMIVESGVHSPQTDPNLPQLCLLLLFRQDLLLLHYNINRSMLFVVVAIIMISAKVLQYLMTFLLLRHKDIEKLFTKIDDCLSFRFALEVLNFYLQLQITLLHLPFSTLCMINFSTCMDLINQGDNAYFGQLLLTILTYLFWQVDYLITFTIASTPLTFKSDNLDVQHISIISYLDYFLKQIQILFFCIIKDDTLLQGSVQILFLISAFSILGNQIFNQAYVLREQRRILIYLVSLQIVVGIYYFSILLNNQLIDYIVIHLFLYPIIINALFRIDKVIHNKLFFNIYKDQEQININQLILQIQLILNKCDSDSSMIPFKTSLINKFQQKYLKNNEKKLIIDGSSPMMNSQFSFNRFIQKKIFLITNPIEKQTVKLTHQNSQNLIIAQTKLLYDFESWCESIKNLIQILVCNFRNQNFLVKTNTSLELLKMEEFTNKREQNFLQVKISLNLVDLSKLTYLLYWAKLKLVYFLGNENKDQNFSQTTDFIKQFIEYDNCLRQIQQETVQTLNNKINFYNQYREREEQDLNHFEKITMKFCLQLIRCNKSLKRIYKVYPCISVQRCLCFFQCELLNNYYEASKTTIFTSMQIDKLFRSKKIVNYDIQAYNTAYSVLSIKGELDDFQIEYASPQFLKIIGKNKTQILNFSDLLPKFMKTWHPLFISKFFIDGQSRYYKSFNQSFISNHLGLLKSVYLCYDITKVYSNQNLVFAGFIQELPDQKCFILCHRKDTCLQISENFFKKIGFDQRLIFGLPEAQAILTGLYLSYLLPEFAQLQQESDSFQLNTELRFLDYAFLRNCQADKRDLGIIILDQNQWQKDDQVNLYQVSIIVTKRYVSNQSYILIEFLSVNKIVKKSSDISEQSKLLNKRDLQSEKAELDLINDSFPSLRNQSEEAEPKKINIFDFRMNEFSRHEQMQQEQEFQNVLSFREDEGLRNIPPPSDRRLLSDDKKENQQEFFNSQLLSMESFQQSLQQYHQSGTKKKSNYNVIDDRQSVQSSIDGLKESQLFKKFEMLEKIIKTKKSDKLLIYLSLAILQIIFVITFSIIVITLISSQLMQFVSEIDMISLHASIMAPHDMYLSCRVTITAYQQQQREKYIDNKTLTALIEPLYQFNAPYYFDLQSSIFSVLQNDHLQIFFNDQNVTVYQMGNNDTVIYPMIMAFREELVTILQYQYQFKRIFDQRKSTAGQTCQVFQFSNYFNLHDKLEFLTNEILEYSKNRSYLEINKWFIVMLLFQLLSIFLGAGALISKRMILRSYEKVLNFFFFADNNSLEQEINKLKSLNTIIQSNSDWMIQYRFNLQEREQIVNKKKKQIILSKIDQPKKFKVQKLEKTRPIITFLLIYCYFGIYSIIIYSYTKTYLTKYGQTTDFYRLIQDLRFRSGNIYVYRELFFRWSNFTYMKPTDLERLYGLVTKSQNVIQIYLNDLSNLQNDKYLFSDSYLTFADSLQNTNLCDFIEKKYSNLTQYCPVAFDGVLAQGMIPSLNYISKAIQSQQAVNNFTKRVEVHLYELEGAQIITLVFLNLSKTLKQGMIDLTTQFNSTNEIVSYLFLISQLILFILYLTYVRNSLIKEFKILKHSFYLIPISVLTGDNALERALKQYEFTEKI